MLEWVAMPSTRGSSWPRDRTYISWSSCLGRQFFTTSVTWQVPRSSIRQVKVGLANSSTEDASQPLPARILKECCLCQALNPLTSILQLTSCDLETKSNLNYPRREVCGLSLPQLQVFTTQQGSRINTRAWQWQKVALRLDIESINLLDFAYTGNLWQAENKPFNLHHTTPGFHGHPF